MPWRTKRYSAREVTLAPDQMSEPKWQEGLEVVSGREPATVREGETDAKTDGARRRPAALIHVRAGTHQPHAPVINALRAEAEGERWRSADLARLWEEVVSKALAVAAEQRDAAVRRARAEARAEAKKIYVAKLAQVRAAATQVVTAAGIKKGHAEAKVEAERQRSADLIRLSKEVVSKALAVAAEQRDAAVREARAEERTEATQVYAAKLARVCAAAKRALAAGVRKVRTEAKHEHLTDLVLLRAQVTEAFRQHQRIVGVLTEAGFLDNPQVAADGWQPKKLDVPPTPAEVEGAAAADMSEARAEMGYRRQHGGVREALATAEADLSRLQDFATYLRMTQGAPAKNWRRLAKLYLHPIAFSDARRGRSSGRIGGERPRRRAVGKNGPGSRSKRRLISG